MYYFNVGRSRYQIEGELAEYEQFPIHIENSGNSIYNLTYNFIDPFYF